MLPFAYHINQLNIGQNGLCHGLTTSQLKPLRILVIPATSQIFVPLANTKENFWQTANIDEFFTE